jgi:ribosomal protein S18 acetylase RimI-like enzyme
MDITIRTATIEDIPQLQALHVHLHKDNAAYDTLLDLDWPTDKRGLAYFTKVIQDNTSVVYIAENDGEMVGYLAGGHKDINYRKTTMAEIYSMVVAPSFQSNGVGEKLVNEFKSWAKTHEYGKVYVNVYFSNERGIAFYKRCGLMPIDMSLEVDV